MGDGHQPPKKATAVPVTSMNGEQEPNPVAERERERTKGIICGRTDQQEAGRREVRRHGSEQGTIICA